MSNRGTSTTRPTVLRGAAADSAASAFAHNTMQTFDVRAVTNKSTAAEIAEAARIDGFNQGYTEGIEAARAEVEAMMNDANTRVRRALAALCEAVDGFDRREATALAAVEDEITAGALAVAHAVLQRELNVMTNPGAEAIARAMKLVPATGNAIARLHPDDAETLSTDNISTTSRTVQVVADPSIEPGGCIVEIGTSRIDAQLSSALANVTKAMEITPAQLPDTNEFVRSAQVSDEASDESAVAGSNASFSGTTASEAPIF